MNLVATSFAKQPVCNTARAAHALGGSNILGVNIFEGKQILGGKMGGDKGSCLLRDGSEDPPWHAPLFKY
jgi:hypothetical protein